MLLVPRFVKAPKQPDERSLLAYATWLLARREYTAHELLTKFRTRFIADESLFAAAIAKLIALGLQSDERATRTFIDGHAGWGAVKLRLHLARRGVASNVIDAVLADASDDEEARARDAFETKLRGNEPPTDFRERQKLLAFLVRRGFSLNVARRVVGL